MYVFIDHPFDDFNFGKEIKKTYFIYTFRQINLSEQWLIQLLQFAKIQLNLMPAKLKAKQAKVDAKKADVSKSADKKQDSAKKVDLKSIPKTKANPKADPPVKATKSNVSAKSVTPAKDTKKSPLKKSATKQAPSPKKDPSPKKGLSPAKKGKRDAPVAVDKKDATSGVKKTKSDEQIVKVITKGGAAVDILVPNKESFRVYQDAGKNYSATLNQANLDQNNNKFYIIQVLLNETTGNIHVWNRWGRVGVPGQNALKGPMTKEQCLKEFNTKLHEKTVKGDYKQIEIKYDDEEEVKEEPKAKGKGEKKDVASKMDAGLQKLISLIFDINIMNNTMKEIGYDAKRMPLGKLGDTTIKEAYTILTKLTTAVKKDKDACKSLSSQFYTLIPHDFGFQKMSNFILDNEEKVKQKLKMLETISDLKITSKLLDQKTNDESSVHDQNYKKLNCDIKTVDAKSADYKLLQEYFNNTKGGYSKVKIGEAYEVVRDQEQKQFNKKIGNNMLLWHGSRVSNFVGILSQGLRIAPPEAPVSGYLFGKGIYLADMAEKSINYCRSYGQDSALILLIEGAIGDPNILTSTNSSAKEQMQKNKKNSTKCHGAKAPPESSYVKLKDIIVPKGQPKPTSSGSYMGHNEYIVYSKSQARIRYILRMEMNGN